MVMANPIETTNVNAVPFCSGEAVAATSVENCGESAATEIPQITRYRKNKAVPEKIINGESKQHNPEIDNE